MIPGNFCKDNSFMDHRSKTKSGDTMTNEELERLIERTDERIEFANAVGRMSDVGYLEAVRSTLLKLQSEVEAN